MRWSAAAVAWALLISPRMGLAQMVTPQVRMEVRQAIGIERDIVRRIVVRNLGQAAFCYQQALQHDPDLHGSIEVEAVIRASGDVVSSAVVHTDLGASSVPTCVLAAFRRWQFTESEAGVRSARVMLRFWMPPDPPRRRGGIGLH